MNYRMMGRFLAQILAIEGALMIPAMAISLFNGDSMAVRGFLYSILLAGIIAAALWHTCRHAPSAFYAKDGLVCVGVCWIVMSLVGCLPFWISREIPRYIDAFFEIVSGFTTTGSSILPNVEALSRGILFWRSFSHWIGGMGVLVFMLAFTGGKEQGYTMHLLRAESPGPAVGKLVPRMRKTAGILYLLYVVMTVLNIIFLLLGDMPLLEALCTAFGTAGTGGLGVKGDSMASYSPYLQNVTTVFMALFGINFSCYYLLLLGQWRSVFRDEELRLYLILIFGSILLITINLGDFYPTLEETVRHAAFQVSTIITTTGYGTTDFDLWPAFSKSILVCLMMVGACAGSTGGGLKLARLLLLCKSLGRNIRQTVSPRKVMVVRNNDQVVDEKILRNADAYFVAYVMIIFISYVIVSLDNFSFGTNFTAVIACFNNIGPGLEQVGPTCNFAAYSDLSKLVLCFDMLAGRLEIFPILTLLSPTVWKNK